MGGNSMSKEALVAEKHNEIERKQSIRDQPTIKNSTQISNGSQQQRASPLSALATLYYNTIMKDYTTEILQSNNEEKKKIDYDLPTDFPSQS